MKRSWLLGIVISVALENGAVGVTQPAVRADSTSSVVFYADRFPGMDILVQTSAAFAACNWECTVVIPPSPDGHPYTASTTLAIPLRNLSAPTLSMTGACVTYTGNGYAVDTYEVQPNPAGVRLRILDGCLTGTAAALGGVRLLPTSDVMLLSTRIANFTHGDAIAIYGTEDVNIFGNYSLTNNRYGVRIQGTFCRQGLPLSRGEPDYSCTDKFDMKGCDGTTFVAHDGVCGYAGNMVHVHDGALSNLMWDIYEQGPPGLEHLSNSYENNELNGGGGGLFLEMSRGDRISSNYFEAKNGRFIVLGNAVLQPEFYRATATTIESNYFTTNGISAISLENANGTSIANNAELPGSRSACFLDSKAIGPTFYSNNTVASTDALCRHGRSNAGAKEAAMAHFQGDPSDPQKLSFVFREDDAGNVFLGGPALSPHGTCAGAGEWVHSRDGHVSVCMGGVWVQKL